MEPPCHLDHIRDHLVRLDGALLVALEHVGQMLTGQAEPGTTPPLFFRCSAVVQI